MKKVLVFIVFGLFLITCDSSDEKGRNETSLTINNLSDYPLLSVEYSSVEFGNIISSKDVTRKVNSGTKYIFFVLQTSTSGMVRCRTEALTCLENKKNEIVITNNTIITITVSEKRDTLRNICMELKVPAQFYDIGDIGPGGGIVFFASGGQYKECSNDLGSYGYSDAVSTASNYKGGGFSNWHLPDYGELEMIYHKIHKNSKGNFQNSYYWSTNTTSNNFNYRYTINFESGSRGEGFSGNSDLRRVIAVRAFSP
jgi:hypothetical protein